ncbi:glycosyltransferase [Ruegeria sp. 2012CJ41-6]|uniref:Glycosyltransferase n=1 Tax=Ruegeria spongiae TaxID=2942209 RepID=A0ABT0Q5V3_9RHOB|nr:glycosyltransferase [Ruegeria spongiae]MCL6285261.1 glycosyltransferase [Ruegeria spongiae]
MQGAPRQLVALVVTYNRLDKLKVTLARLLASDVDALSALVVVDNASTDGTMAWLDGQTDPRLDVLRSQINRGGAGGFEWGMRHAMERYDPDWLMITDDDGRPEPDALTTFHRLDLSRWDALAAAVYFPSGEICEMNRPSRNPFWHWREFLGAARRGRNGFHIPHSAYEGDLRPIDVTSFVGFFVSRAAIARVGYPDGRLFIYGDDGIYTLGLSKAGGRIAFAPQIRFEHDFTTFAGSGLAKGQRFNPLWKVYYHHRNLLLLYRLAAGWLFAPACLAILPKWLLKARYHGGQRRAFLRLMGRAILDGLRGRVDVSHAQVLAWAETPSFSDSEYPGESGAAAEARKTVKQD